MTFNTFKPSSQYWDEKKINSDPLLDGVKRIYTPKEMKALAESYKELKIQRESENMEAS